MTPAPAALLLRRIGWVSVCAVSATFLQSIFHQPIGITLASGVVVLIGLAAVRPFEALLVFAAIGPLSTILFTIGNVSAGAVQFSETLALAYLTGWTARRAFDGRPLSLSPVLRWCAVLLLIAAAGSAIVQGAVMRAEAPGEQLAEVLRLFVLRDYVLHFVGSSPVTGALLLCESMLLLIVAADVCAGDPRKRDAVLRMMITGAAAAAAFNVLRIVTLAVQREHGWDAFVGYLATLRVNVHYGDRNAAGSYFAMMLVLSIGWMARSRARAIVCTLPIAAALWLSGSRFALAGAFAGVAAAGLLALKGRGARRTIPLLAGVAIVAIAAVGLWKLYPQGRNFAASKALAIRVELARAGLQMARERPLFGVGVSRYYDLSDRYAGTALAQLGFVRENAHNNFVQILAELGVPGLVLLVAIIVLAVRETWRSAHPLPAMSLGLLGGIAAFVVTCLGGHPLIVPEAAYPFWLALGLAAAPASVPPRAVPRMVKYSALALIVVLAATLPSRASDAMRHAEVGNVTAGLSMWQHQDGLRFRWAGGRSRFYAPASARFIRIPLMNGFAERRTLEVRVFIEGREVDRILLPANDLWREQRILLPHDSARRSYVPIDLVAGLPGAETPLEVTSNDHGGLVKVGRPEIED